MDPRGSGGYPATLSARAPGGPEPTRSPRGRAVAPLPHRDGVPPARFSMPTGTSYPTVAEFLAERTRGAPEVLRRLAAREVLLGDGTVVTEHTAYRPGQWVYLHRDVPEETPVPGELTLLHQDERILVVDKPPFLATTPRGRHVRETVLARLRRQPGWEQVQPAHRLDRLTAGVLLLTREPAVRRDYQELFATRAVTKTYLAVVTLAQEESLPAVVRSRIEKVRGQLQAVEVPGEPNAVTRIEVLGRAGDRALVRLQPQTGRTHQLRVHLSGLGAPIVGDPLYPQVLDVAPDDFSQPLQLLAAELALRDPVTGLDLRFVSAQRLALAGAWWAGPRGQ